VQVAGRLHAGENAIWKSHERGVQWRM